MSNVFSDRQWFHKDLLAVQCKWALRQYILWALSVVLAHWDENCSVSVFQQQQLIRESKAQIKNLCPKPNDTQPNKTFPAWKNVFEQVVYRCQYIIGLNKPRHLKVFSHTICEDPKQKKNYRNWKKVSSSSVWSFSLLFMANQGAKKRKDENARHMAKLRLIMICCNVLPLPHFSVSQTLIHWA